MVGLFGHKERNVMWNYVVGHLIGDFLVQSDWEANNKTWAKRKWFGLIVAAFHSFYITSAIFGLCQLSGTPFQWWKFLLVWFTHTIQDWTRFPFKLMAIRGQFEGIKFSKLFLYGDCIDGLSSGPSYEEGEEIPSNTAYKICGKFPEHAYLWACFVVDQVWHMATYYIIFLL